MIDLSDVRKRLIFCRGKFEALKHQIDQERVHAATFIVEHTTNNSQMFSARALNLPSDYLRYETALINAELIGSLNALVQKLAQDNGKNDVRGVDFFVSESEQAFKERDEPKLRKALKSDHADAIRNLQPWNGGHPHLFFMKALENRRKHYASVEWMTSVSLTFSGKFTGQLMPKSAILKRQGDVYSLGSGFDLSSKIGMGTQLVFDVPFSREHKPVVDTLQNHIDAADEILDKFT